MFTTIHRPRTRLHHRLPALSGFMACLSVLQSVAGQTCLIPETARVPVPSPQSHFFEFGGAAAAEGDRALVAGGNSNFASFPGTVYALRRVAGAWSVTQTIASPDASNTDKFGASLAISGNWAIVGAPQEDPGGAAYLYAWDGSQWVYHSRVTPADPSNNKRFGNVVDIDGETAVMSADGDIQGGNASAGAAYVFRYDGAAWVQDQKLIEQSPAPQRRFGAAVATDGGTVLVAAVPSGTNPNNAEGVYVYRHDGAAWQEMQRIQSPVWPGYEGFGATLRIDGDTLAVSAVPNSAPGQVRMYEFDGEEWVIDQTIAGPPVTIDGNFGGAFDLSGDRLVIGAPHRDAPTYPDDIPAVTAGLGFLYGRPSGGAWSLRHTVRTKPRYNIDSFAYFNRDDRLGSSAAIAGDEYLLGATMSNDNTEAPGGYVAVYDMTPPDCDRNGTPDACDTDCDRDDAVDACEIAADPTLDCDDDGQIDVCQEPADYVLDTAFGQSIWGATLTPLDFIWLNQFTVQAGGQRITHLAVPWTLFTPTGLDATLLIYDDPNNDGDPHDAVLLTSTIVASTDPDLGVSPIPDFTLYPVPSTPVGGIGESFFIGVKMSLEVDQFAAMSQSGPNPGNRSWRIFTTFGEANLDDLSANPNFNPHSSRWILRAHGLDCNGNGVWDDCDIAGGTSLDLNNNGIPDECDAPCPADINGSSGVDVDDLLAVINAWGACPNPRNCPADIAPTGGNDVVNVDDLLAVINAWGNCP